MTRKSPGCDYGNRAADKSKLKSRGHLRLLGTFVRLGHVLHVGDSIWRNVSEHNELSGAGPLCHGAADRFKHIGRTHHHLQPPERERERRERRERERREREEGDEGEREEGERERGEGEEGKREIRGTGGRGGRGGREEGEEGERERRGTGGRGGRERERERGGRERREREEGYAKTTIHIAAHTAAECVCAETFCVDAASRCSSLTTRPVVASDSRATDKVKGQRAGEQHLHVIRS
ncbi:unnamed protein product [Pleuronectes platessa]|uniref:Uncharacterized protein n=1 Tax=Pleuronectes platessa TaxID=8262 RepID=A0A9N7U9X3_PLEPL|nr:unnamed protein product [Pleuronectes platessa]